MTYSNEVLIQGNIVHKFVTPKVAIITIGTGDSTQKTNYPKVVFFGENIKNVENNYNVKDHVKINGYIQSTKYNPEIKNQNTLSIIGTQIEKPADIMEEKFGIKGSTSVYKYANEIKICGRITFVDRAFDNLVKFRVLVEEENRKNFITLTYYTYKADEVMEQYKVGDCICALGVVQTAKKMAKGVPTFFENFVAEEIIKIED